MTREDPSASGQPLCRDRRNVVSSNRVDAERSVNNVCLQTGEEFFSEFLRDRVAVRRITVMNDGKYLQPIQAGVNINQNHQVVCEDLNGIVGLRRMANEGNANASDFAGTFGYALEAKKNNYPDNLSRCQLQYGAIGQNSGYAESPFTRKMKFLCSFGGRIFPRPSDGKLRYVGGEIRITSTRKSLTWEELMRKTSAICNQPHTIKYQLPGEPDSANSLEGKTTQQTDADNQYVSAVNGMLDASPRRSSSGQTLASHTTHLGRDSPTFAYISEIKDHSPNSSNLGGMFSNNANRLPPICVAGKSLNPSVPVTGHDKSSTHRLEEGIISQSPRNIGRAKSPSVAVSSSSRGFSMHWQDVIDEKHQGTTCQNQPLFKMLESCNDNFKTIQEIKAMNGTPLPLIHIGNTL
ncbi:hypothetical protein WN944_026453 [Citrus x changshan-huyou]|uniref:PB1 domain-containing protein n=1 Tax=Citrus x changshan-huyou TaxID=2935761 RepID=A0AAP0LSI7_9ROSI